MERASSVTVVTSEVRVSGAGPEGVGAFEVRDPDKENVAFLLAMKSFHRMHIPDQALAFRSEAEALQQRFDDESAAYRAAYGRAGHESNSGVIATLRPFLLHHNIYM